MNCNQLIEKLYTNKKISDLISKIKPVELQDDLKQELAMALLNMDCNKLKDIEKNGNLIGFALAIVWKMGTLQKTDFYKTYKKSEHLQALEYMKYLQGNDINYRLVNFANKLLEQKLSKDANEAHESIIFRKYVELRNMRKVAEYFDIPSIHVFQVVKKMKKELKKELKGRC